MQQITIDWNKMVTGRFYNPSDKNVVKQHKNGMYRCDHFNKISLQRSKAKKRAMERLLHQYP